MARTALLCALPALLIATGWSQLEATPKGGEIVLVAALGVGVALLRRGWLQAVGAVVALLVAAGLAFGVSPLDARPFDGDRDFFGPLFSGIWNGTLDYYEVTIPFDPSDRPRMHGVLLLATFVFTLGAAVSIARGRPVLACALTFAGAAWPVTLIRDAPATARGALLLVAALILFAALRPTGGRGTRQTALVGGAVLVASLVAVSSPAVAKGAFLAWEQWEPFERTDRPVDVSYVWDADYDGIRFPKRSTTVLTVRAPREVAYWRATTLDGFLDDRWFQSQDAIEPTVIDGRDVLLDDPMVPPDAANEDTWIEQVVEVHALRDNHLVAATVPIAFEQGEAAFYTPGVGHVDRLRRGQDYRVWSYIQQPSPSPERLAASPPVYPDVVEAGQYLGIGLESPAPTFGTPGRDDVMRALFSDEDARVYEPLYDAALEVVGEARNPYAAVVALEAWFREGGDFEYNERPPVRAGVPPLVAFVNDHRNGYCQHFAGAMALMLRYLGIPARVGAGFTNGRYDSEDNVWTVADTNAHTWVEVWFAGYGWLPFDPTPGRGRLGGTYTSSSFTFDVSGATDAFGVGAAALGLDVLRGRLGDGGPNAANDRVRGLDPGGTAAAQAAAAEGGRGSGSLIALLLLLAAAATAGLWLLKFVRRHLRYLTRDPRRLAGAVRLDLADYLVDQRMQVSASATPAELATELEHGVGVPGDRLGDALAAARYGPLAQAEASARHARKELRAVRRRLRRRLGTRARLRGLVSLRSLGLGS